MLKQDGGLIPHSHCTVASGDCLSEGKCLANCTARQKVSLEKRIQELERQLMQLTMACIRHGIRL